MISHCFVYFALASFIVYCNLFQETCQVVQIETERMDTMDRVISNRTLHRQAVRRADQNLDVAMADNDHDGHETAIHHAVQFEDYNDCEKDDDENENDTSGDGTDTDEDTADAGGNFIDRDGGGDNGGEGGVDDSDEYDDYDDDTDILKGKLPATLTLIQLFHI